MYKTLKTIGKRLLPERAHLFIRKFYIKLRNRFKYGEADFFSAVEFENITSCNRRCSYCPNSIYERGLAKNKKIMDEKIFMKIIDELAEINFSGRVSPVFFGEPLLDERLEEIVRHIRIKLPKAQIIIFSNGDLINFDAYKKLIAAGVDLFVITEHGESMSYNMKELLKNFHEVRYKEYYLHDSAFAPIGKSRASILYRDLKKQKNLYNRGGLLKHMSPIKIKKTICKLPSDILLIDYQGNVILCCNDYFSTIKFGNIREETILQIWHKPVFSKIRNDLKKGILNLEICKKCKVAG